MERRVTYKGLWPKSKIIKFFHMVDFGHVLQIRLFSILKTDGEGPKVWVFWTYKCPVIWRYKISKSLDIFGQKYLGYMPNMPFIIFEERIRNYVPSKVRKLDCLLLWPYSFSHYLPPFKHVRPLSNFTCRRFENVKFLRREAHLTKVQIAERILLNRRRDKKANINLLFKRSESLSTKREIVKCMVPSKGFDRVSLGIY